VIGICTRYSRHEATYAAIRLANWASMRGQDVSLFTMTERPGGISPIWDKRVIVNQRDMLFADWVQTCDKVIWTTTPPVAQIEWVKQQRKLAYLLVLWHELTVDDRPAMVAATRCICPSVASADLLRNWGLRNVTAVPWDCGEPVFTKPSQYQVKTPNILLPLYDGNARRTELTAIELVGRAMYRNPDVTFTVAYNSSTIASCGSRRLRQLKRAFKGRLTLQKGIAPRDHPLLYQRHDLTLWPTHYESTCMIGLMSVTMGTPVLAFGFRPTLEVLHDMNAIIVRTNGEQTNDMGCPRVVPDYAMMDDLLNQAIADPEYLQELHKTVLRGVLERRSLFDHQLSQVFI